MDEHQKSIELESDTIEEVRDREENPLCAEMIILDNSDCEEDTPINFKQTQVVTINALFTYCLTIYTFSSTSLLAYFRL